MINTEHREATVQLVKDFSSALELLIHHPGKDTEAIARKMSSKLQKSLVAFRKESNENSKFYKVEALED